ncbi:MAG: hypothetical protein ACE5EX_03990 [Phycisphaerae bacterium]
MTTLTAQLTAAPAAPYPASVIDLRALALRALRRMYLPKLGLFAFRLRRSGDEELLEGVSPRYTAIALIGLAGEDPHSAREALRGADRQEVCGHLLHSIRASHNVGDVALAYWAATALDHPAAATRDQLLSLHPWAGPCPTVELAWALTALSIEGKTAASTDNTEPAARVARRLMDSFHQRSELFPHHPADGGGSRLRGHIACYADLVYPIQALAHYYRRAGDDDALRLATCCADRMVALQGPAGQWWWHYHVRTGRVVEGYPVYAIHQDAMGPMALLDLADAGGPDHRDAITRGLDWLHSPPEIAGTLIDQHAGVVWRKVARHEPAKLTRTLHAVASRIHPSLRAFGADRIFRPGRVDFESRPYHFGWLLYAWSPARISSWQQPG